MKIRVHCPFCRRIYKTKPAWFAENPWCVKCLHERMMLAVNSRDPLDDVRIVCGLPIKGQTRP